MRCRIKGGKTPISTFIILFQKNPKEESKEEPGVDLVLVFSGANGLVQIHEKQ
jgi:hypothetical protein